jgi:hypothetical protein
VSGVLGEALIALILVAGVCAPIASWLATRRLRNPAVWFVLGAFTGPLAAVLLVAAPPGRCPNCDARVHGWPTWCDACGARLRDGALLPDDDAYEPRPWPEPAPVLRPATTSIMERASIVAPPAAMVAPPASIGPPPTSIDAARTGLRREARPVRPAPSARTPRPAAVRPGSHTPPAFTASNYQLATTDSDPSTGDVLSTGVYISGNAGLEIGACYAIARSGDLLRVFGPVDAGELTVRHEGVLADFEVTAMDDRVIISGREGRSSLAIVFRTIGGMRAADLESALGAPAFGLGGSR